MISFLIFALVVVLVALVVIYICDLLIGMLPNAPAQMKLLVRAIIVLIALLVILERALPLLGHRGLF